MDTYRGFTIVELLIVIVVIAILAALLCCWIYQHPAASEKYDQGKHSATVNQTSPALQGQ